MSGVHTENVARGGKLSFQNVGGGGVYDVLTSKSLGGQELTRRRKSPPPLNAVICIPNSSEIPVTVILEKNVNFARKMVYTCTRKKRCKFLTMYCYYNIILYMKGN